MAAPPLPTQTEARSSYDGGTKFLNSSEWERAISAFDWTIAAKGPYEEGALYWKAYAQFKLSRTEEALGAIGVLRKDERTLARAASSSLGSVY